jgi:hypothetical protein
MATERLAISLDPALSDEIRSCAEASGDTISAWLADAARRKIRAVAARAALADYEAEFGVISEEEVEQMRRKWLA